MILAPGPSSQSLLKEVEVMKGQAKVTQDETIVDTVKQVIGDLTLAHRGNRIVTITNIKLHAGQLIGPVQQEASQVKTCK